MSERRVEDPVEAGRLLRRLSGAWSGTGSGGFPTIDDFRYREDLRFRTHETEPTLHYEQRTWRVSSGPEDAQPSHWESGFLRVQEDGGVELLNAQQSGRVEVLTGALFQLAEGRHQLRLESVVHGHDARLVATRRTLTFSADELAYEVEMATDEVPEPTVHLVAELKRPVP